MVHEGGSISAESSRRGTWVRKPLRALYRFFRSTGTALVLIGYLTAFFAVSSLLGGRLVPGGAGGMLFFYLPLTLFFVNLAVCTVSRMLSTLRSGGYGRTLGWLRIGPDAVHLSLLLLIVAGVVSLQGRVEGVVELAPGQTVVVNNDYALTLEDFAALRYESGSPKAWISTVDVKYRGEVMREGVEIRVNDPLEVGRVTIYQSSFRKAGEELHTVLTAVYDPSGPLIRAALLLLAAGIILVLIRKLREVLRE